MAEVEPLPLIPAQPQRDESSYARNRVSNRFMGFAPLLNGRHVKVIDHRTAVDGAHGMRDLADRHVPEAEKIVGVQDHLNTHTPAALYATFPPQEAKRLGDRLGFHYTPKPGRWLNLSEIELSVFSRQCLNRRMADQSTLIREAAAWERHRHTAQASVHGQSTTTDARGTLKKLYPTIEAAK